MSADGLESIVGQEVSSIEFVRDYLQIRFDRACLSLYVMPMVEVAGRNLEPRTAGYNDAVVSIISKTLQAVSSSTGSIRIELSNGVALSVRVEDAVTPNVEAAELTIDGANKIWVWRRGA